MHDQIERSERTPQPAVIDLRAHPTTTDLLAQSEVIDLRAQPAVIDLREQAPHPDAGSAEHVGAEPALTTRVPGHRDDREHPGLSVWVATLLAVTASLLVILVVAQHPRPAAAMRPIPASLGQQLGPG